jgi:putative molybdopterin biosynthesis protein
MVHPLNPFRLRGLPDLARSEARFVNRQPGSGTRLLMDQLLAEQGLDAASIRGYQNPPEDSHVAVAAAIASGLGDVGPGIESAAQQFGLDFIPLIVEDYFLVCLKNALEHPAVLKLRQALAGPAWGHALSGLPGYEASRSGEVLSLTKALPWWRYRTPKHVTAG